MNAIKFTLEELKKEAKMIYYSAGSLWWTHSEEDLKESTIMGLAAGEISHQKFINDPARPEEDKKRLIALNEGFKKHKELYGTHIPLDPWGAPLYQVEAGKWIQPAEEKPEHFKKYGLEAFMKTHHKNSRVGEEVVHFDNWDQVTEYLDGYYSVANRVKK